MGRNVLLIGCVLILVMTIIVPSFVYATEVEGLGDLDQYKKDAEDMGPLKDKAQGIITIIKIVGVTISVISLMGIGIKYMLGSIEQRAQYKETLKPYLIGAFLVFTVSLIPEIIYNIMQGI